MNNDYIKNASEFLDRLVQEMDVQLFIEQYQMLDHDRLRYSIPLNDERLDDYYKFCLNNVSNTIFNNDANIWSLIMESSLERSHRLLDVELDIQKTFENTERYNNREFNTDSFIKDISVVIEKTRIVNKAKYNTFDTKLDIAA